MLTGQFTLPIQIELAAMVMFGLTGGLAALKRGYDVIGLFAMAFVTAAGGGLIRDGLFIQQGPPAITTDSRFIIVIAVAGLGSVLFRDHVVRFNRIIAWLDAVGLGAFAVVGMEKALDARLSVPAAVLVGVINAAGGGLMRDVLVRDEPLLFKPGQFYVLAALAGCILFGLLTLQFNMEATRAALITMGTTFVLRVMAIQFNWKSRSLLREPFSETGTSPAQLPPQPD